MPPAGPARCPTVSPLVSPCSDPLWDLETPHPQPLSQGGRGEQEYSDFTSDRYIQPYTSISIQFLAPTSLWAVPLAGTVPAQLHVG